MNLWVVISHTVIQQIHHLETHDLRNRTLRGYNAEQHMLKRLDFLLATNTNNFDGAYLHAIGSIAIVMIILGRGDREVFMVGLHILSITLSYLMANGPPWCQFNCIRESVS